MKRTILALPDEIAQALHLEARRQGTSVSAVASEALVERLRLHVAQERDLTFAALGRSGKSDTARHVNQVIEAAWDVDSRR